VTSTTGYAGVYDLSGNVFEWEDSCNGHGQTAVCRVRGGAFDYYGDSSVLACGFVSFFNRDFVNYGFGFRCCSP
jgi:formylglycine-generating enzyme required for sulfatase activity